MEFIVVVIVVKFHRGTSLACDIGKDYSVNRVPAGGAIVSSSGEGGGGEEGSDCECGVHVKIFLFKI